MSVVFRVPEGLYENVRKIAVVQGRQPAELLNEAWEHYLDAHREEVATAFRQYAEQILAGEADGIPSVDARPLPRNVVKGTRRQGRAKVST